MRDLQGLGTPERTWDEGLRAVDRVVLVSPHPDDETLGAGGILVELARRHVPVLVVAVTDGEQSHPGRADELRVLRAAERSQALSALGSDADVHQLHHPDGGVDEERLQAELGELVGRRDLLLAPWSRDGHPDHDACGRAAASLGVAVWSYLVWAWHWATPADLPTARARRVQLRPADQDAKRRAVSAYASQLEGDDPILPPHVRARLLRSSEVVLT